VIYIPDAWMVDVSKNEQVHDILGRHFFTDLKVEGEPDHNALAIAELLQIGEYIIAGMLERHEICFGLA